MGHRPNLGHCLCMAPEQRVVGKKEKSGMSRGHVATKAYLTLYSKSLAHGKAKCERPGADPEDEQSPL